LSLTPSEDISLPTRRDLPNSLLYPVLDSFSFPLGFIGFSFCANFSVNYMLIDALRTLSIGCYVAAVVPGLPVIGNLLQLTEKKPHKTFAKWAEIYGPIYSIRTGASTIVVLNSADVSKEVTLFSCFTFFASILD
jgi:hypothetical protein